MAVTMTFRYLHQTKSTQFVVEPQFIEKKTRQ